MTDLKRNEVQRQLRYTYSQEERIAKGIALAEKLGHLAQLDDELSRVKKDYGNRIDAAQAQADQLSTEVRDGFEMRPYICFWTFDEPKAGRKTLRRKDTGEIVADEEMTLADQQTVMDEIDPATKQPDGLDVTLQGKPPAFIDPPEAPEIYSWESINAVKDVDEFSLKGELATFAVWFNEMWFDASGERFAAESIAACQTEQLEAMWKDEDADAMRRWAAWLASLGTPHASHIAKLVREHPKFTPTEKASKKPRKPRAVSSGGVVGTAEDGDINTPDEDRRSS